MDDLSDVDPTHDTWYNMIHSVFIILFGVVKIAAPYVIMVVVVPLYGLYQFLIMFPVGIISSLIRDWSCTKKCCEKCLDKTRCLDKLGSVKTCLNGTMDPRNTIGLFISSEGDDTTTYI